MRVLFLSPTYLPLIGGAERQLALQARELVRRGHQVLVLTTRVAGAPARECRDGVRVHRVFPRNLPDRLQSPAAVLMTFLYLLLWGWRFDAVHCMFLSVHAVGIAPLRPLFKFRWVVRMACTGAYGDLAPIRGGWRCRLMRWALNRADVALAISADVAAEMQAFGIAASRVRQIPNAVDTERFAPRDRDYARCDRLLFVGRLTEQKNPLAAVQAVQNPELVGWRLTLAGEGPLGSMLEEAGPAEPGRVHLLGRVEDTAPLYQQHDVFVLPSRGEGMSNALLEAMASGMPVLCTRTSGTADLITAGIDGVLLESADADEIARALRALAGASPERRAALGMAARQRVERLCSVRSVVDRIETLYRGGS